MVSILVVDDDVAMAGVVREALTAEGRTIEVVHNDVDAFRAFEERAFDLVLTDLDLQCRRNGVDVVKAVRAQHPRTPVILMTGFGSLQTAVDGVRAGAFDYISKPFQIRMLLDLVQRALQTSGRPPVVPAPSAPLPVGLVGRAAVMLEVYKQIAMAADSQTPVLIVGETGTGKELVAKAIHSFGRGEARPFEALNCAVVPETLLASELFGHARGSFTGAVADKKGLFELANGGTLFLDEIGETTPALQVSLLRVLQESEVRPVGGSRTIRVSARVLAATNRDLETEVAEKRFRQDLFYRLSAFVIRVPPLRERLEDVPMLAAAFLRNACSRARKEVGLAPAAFAALQEHGWPGNVRELENTIERLVISARGGLVRADDVKDLLHRPDTPVSLPADAAFADMPTVDELEKRYMKHVLEMTKGNRTRAAEILGMDRRTLYRKAARFGFPLGASEDEPEDPAEA